MGSLFFANEEWIHIYDIIKYDNKLFMVGAVANSDKSNSERSMIRSSSDGGKIFEDVSIYYNDVELSGLMEGDKVPKNVLRFLKIVEFNNELYAFLHANGDNYSKYDGVYKYDKTNNRFDFLVKKPCNLSTTSYLNCLEEKCRYVYSDVFGNSFLHIGGNKLTKVEDMSKLYTDRFNVKAISTPITDVLVAGDMAYVLTYKTSSSKFDTKIYSTKDFETFDLVYEFMLPMLPYTFEYYDGSFYIGTTTKDYSPTDSEIIGHLYRVGKWEDYELKTEKTAEVKIYKNDQPWAGSNINLALYMNGQVNHSEKTAYSSTIVFNDVESGTYDIYASRGNYKNDQTNDILNIVDTGVDIKVSIGGNATINYYELILNKGTGIVSVSGGGVYLNKQKVSISATASTNYTWLKWIVSSGISPANPATASTTVILTKSTILNATSKSNSEETVDDYTFDDKVKVDKDKKYLKNMKDETTVFDMISKVKINNSKFTVKVLNTSNKSKNNTDLLSSGDKLVIYKNGTKDTEYEIAVIGDANGDSKVDDIDLLQMRKHIIKWVDPSTNKVQVKTGIYYYGLDLNQDGTVDDIDLLRLRKRIVGYVD